MQSVPEYVTGIDLSDKKFDYATLCATGELVEERSVELSKEQLEKHFGPVAPRLIALEVGTHSAWVKEELERLEHEVLVADPREIWSITRSAKKTDREDALKLAQLARAGMGLLSEVKHRDKKTRAHLQICNSRASLVRTRTEFVNRVRGILKSYDGIRIPSCSPRTLPRTVRNEMEVPEEILVSVAPFLNLIEQTTAEIDALQRKLEDLAVSEYPETGYLLQVNGVGFVTALTFVLTIEDLGRFKDARTVAAYLGLTPRQHRSGETEKQLRITKEGDSELRRLLVICAHKVLAKSAPDTDLKRFGEALCTKGGKNAKKRAVVAVARKLAVLLFTLWRSRSKYEPLRNARLKEERGGAGPAA